MPFTLNQTHTSSFYAYVFFSLLLFVKQRTERGDAAARVRTPCDDDDRSSDHDWPATADDSWEQVDWATTAGDVWLSPNEIHDGFIFLSRV
jgi:hypothetical protein